MNPEAQAIFDKLVKMNPQDLTKEQCNFLHARRPYMNDEQIRVFKEVLDARDAELEGLTKPPLYISRKEREKNGKKN